MCNKKTPNQLKNQQQQQSKEAKKSFNKQISLSSVIGHESKVLKKILVETGAWKDRDIFLTHSAVRQVKSVGHSHKNWGEKLSAIPVPACVAIGGYGNWCS